MILSFLIILSIESVYAHELETSSGKITPTTCFISIATQDSQSFNISYDLLQTYSGRTCELHQDDGNPLSYSTLHSPLRKNSGSRSSSCSTLSRSRIFSPKETDFGQETKLYKYNILATLFNWLEAFHLDNKAPPPDITSETLEEIYQLAYDINLHQSTTEEGQNAWNVLAHQLSCFSLDPDNMHLVQALQWQTYASAIVCNPVYAHLFRKKLDKTITNDPTLSRNNFNRAWKYLEEGVQSTSLDKISCGTYKPIPWRYAHLLAQHGVGIFSRKIIASDDDIVKNFNQIRLIFSVYPHLPLIIDFGKKITSRDNFYIPGSVKQVTMVGDITHIGDSFLSGCRNLITVDLHALKKLQHIGSNFLFGLNRLENLNLPEFSKETIFGNYFLAGCTQIKTIKFPSPCRVNQIGDGFLHYCMSLTFANFDHLTELRSVGKYFLYGCHCLTLLDMSQLKNLEYAGYGFLHDCPNLELVTSPTEGLLANFIQWKSPEKRIIIRNPLLSKETAIQEDAILCPPATGHQGTQHAPLPQEEKIKSYRPTTGNSGQERATPLLPKVSFKAHRPPASAKLARPFFRSSK